MVTSPAFDLSSLQGIPLTEGIDLAVLDWGIGGTAIYSALSEILKGASILYLSDSGFTPYGKASRTALRARLGSICAALAATGCRRLVVACNAMSSAFDLSGEYFADVETSGVIGPGISSLASAAGAAPGNGIGIIGGKRTILSRSWARPLRKLGYRVEQRVAQPLSGMIERGEQDGADFALAAKRICHPLSGCGTLVLACTHYPAALGVFRDIFPGIAIFDPAAAVVKRIVEKAPEEWRVERCKPRRAFTTGDPMAATRAAKLAFGLSLDFAASSIAKDR